MKEYKLLEIGKPEEQPEREVVPVYDPVPREAPIRIPSEPRPIREPVPA